MFDLRSSSGVFRRGWFAIVILVLAAGLPATASAQNSNNGVSKESLQEARDKFDKLREKFDQTNEKKQNISTNISSLEKDRRDLNRHLVETGAKVKNIEKALSAVERKLGKLSVREQRIKRSMAKRHEVIAALLSVMQRMGRQPPPVMATHRDDALKMVRSAMLLSSVIPKLSKELKETSSELSKLVSVVTETKQSALTLRQETINLKTQRDRVKKLLNAKRTRILSQQNELKQVQAAAKAYSRNAQNLGQLIAKLDQNVSRTMGIDKYEKEVRRGKKGISRVDPKTGQKVRLVPGKKTRVTSLINPGRIKPALAFSRAQGLLPLPVSGSKVKKYGDTNDYGSTSKGLLLGTRNNAQVTSPCDGWVLYAGRFRSYGQLLIINAGEGYHILLAGMGKIDVSTGQFVLAGEPIASMGAQRLQAIDAKQGYDQTLYIEFRKNERPINPDPWWAEG
ncbi:MAG: murein hydrolase activator EnvC family protein [Methyloligellaceae bacterium]